MLVKLDVIGNALNDVIWSEKSGKRKSHTKARGTSNLSNGYCYIKYSI